MSDKSRSDFSSFFVWFSTLTLWSLASCSKMRSVKFVINHELDDKTIADNAALTLYDVKRPATCALRCSQRFPCAFFFHNKARGVCVLHRSPFLNFNLTHAPGYKSFTTAELPLVPLDTETGLCPNDSVGCWKQVSGFLNHVSVGPAGVWGVNSTYVFYRTGTYGDTSASGQQWYRVHGFKIQVDVGSDAMCGTNNVNRGAEIYRRSDISSSLPYGSSAGINNGWTFITSNRTWVTLSPAGSVWAVDRAGQILHARDAANRLSGSTQWDVVAAGMRRVDAGRAGVWALDGSGRLHYRRGTYGDDGTSTGTGWVTLGGAFSFVSSGTDLVVVVTCAGRVWVRVGVSADAPAGLGWVLYPGVMKQVEVYEAGSAAGLWAVDFNSKIYFSVIEK